MTRLFDLKSERAILKTSVLATLLIAALGIGFGLVAGSFSIIFDGIYSLVDASMSLLSLMVVKLIASHAITNGESRKLRERFNMGFWHLEPMVLAFNSLLLICVAIYALIQSISSILEGGRELRFDVAIVYALATVIICTAIAFIEARANKTIQSEFIRLDVKGWIMSSGITAALLMAFCIGYAVQDTQLEWTSPYIDPTVLALVCLVIIPLPFSTVRQAFSDIFLITPVALKQHVDQIAHEVVVQQGFLAYRTYVAKVGRSRAIELYFIVPPEMPARTIAEWDALRDEIGHAIGDESTDRWLTIVFTGDREWAE